MSNDEMKPGRFLKLYKGRKMFRWISEQIVSGRRVVVCTYTHATIYKAISQFKLGASGSVYSQHGKRWDCIDGCALRAE